MERIIDLEATTSRVVASYAGRSLNAKLHYLHDNAQKIDTVLVVPLKREIEPHIMLLTRIDGEKVIIETDTTDRPLEDALIAAGIPPSQIVLAHQGD